MKRVMLLTGLVIATLTGCQPDEQAVSNSEITPYVITTQPITGAELSWQLIGRIEPQQQAELAFQVAGKVIQRHVNPGDTVKKGQLLLKLDATDLNLQQQAVQAALKAVETELNHAKTEAQRAQDLVKRNLLSQQDLDQAQNRVSVLTQQLAQKSHELTLTQRQLNYTNLYAPEDGILQDVLIEPGQIVQLGQPVVRLFYQHRYDVVVNVPESRIHHLPATANWLLDEQTSITLERYQHHPQADAGTQTWQVKYAIPAEQNGFAIGQRVKLTFGETQSLFQIPLTALIDKGETSFVWIVEQGQVKPINVEVKQLTQTHALVSAELNDQSRIVKTGVHLLQAGQAVQERF